MVEAARATIICDTRLGGGHLFFYDEHFEWRSRSLALASSTIKVRYEDIEDIKIIPTHKKEVRVILKSGEEHTLLMYKTDAFIGIIQERLQSLKNKDIVKSKHDEIVEIKENKKVAPKAKAAEEGDDMLSKIVKLSELKEKGLLTDEEFALAKKKILEGK